MSLDRNWKYAILWEFQVNPEFQSQFEQAYGASGDWAQLFRSGDGYSGTELIRDETDPYRYVTIDLWRSRQDYETFRNQHADEYRRIDVACERMTETERALGTFERATLSR
ncbi:MAG TPA: antibiotic biosynthesis monooxygenase [Terriglobales bacterium]|nr:antibiotic biosynthesis monooxygenase [Terriglobales bacterium]